MQLDQKAYGDTKAFASDYGVIETTFEVAEEEYQSTRRTVVHKKKDRLLPGVSPLVYARFLMENAVFISLYDMGKALPDYEEIPIGLAMSDDVAREYEHIQKYFQALSRSDPQQASALQSASFTIKSAVLMSTMHWSPSHWMNCIGCSKKLPKWRCRKRSAT